ncbi:MAG: EAL domain-containing protein [Actinomycetales bacterium]|nr:EAL domain-containing protein [Actinomycetales bacterium]
MAAWRLGSLRDGDTVVRLLTWAGWAVVVVSGLAGFAANPAAQGEADESILVISLAVFFIVLVARLLLFAFLHRNRRTALVPLIIGVVLYATGSAVLNGAVPASATTFPAPGEWLFISAYVAFAAFLVLDANQRNSTTLTAWLDAVILIGAVAAAAGGLLLTPFVNSFPEGGVPLLVAILYPMIALAFAIVVIGQSALSARSWGRSTTALVLGFLALALAESSLVLTLGLGTYAFTTILSILYGLAFLLLADGATAPRAPIASISRRLPPAFLIASFLVAITMLLLRPTGLLGWAISIPAALTLVATGARLAIALQESRRATEAFQLAQTDDLTGLPNRRAVLKALDDGIAEQREMGLMLLDLDGFKEVNDTLGHSAGDALLELVALRMRDALPHDMLLCRLGGDEFAIVTRHADELRLLEEARSIRETLLAPAKVDGMDLAMHASVGIAVRQPEDARAADLLRRADVAMYEAKVTRSGAQLYDAGRDEFSRQRLKMGEDLRRGLAKGDVITWYQPKVDTLTSQVIGVEALVRWDHPERGMIPPMAFLSVARRSGLMQSLSETVIALALADAAKWRAAGLDLNVAINIAPSELLSGALLPLLYETVETSGVPSHAITIEVTEDTFLADPERAREIIMEMRRHGLKTSIDDYGTGFSSLAYLRDLPITELKLDRSFVSTVTTDERSRLIVESTVSMAHALDLRVVAEGVENADTHMEVVRMGIDLLQGYYMSPPMPSDQVLAWVQEWNSKSLTGGANRLRQHFPFQDASGS